MIRFVCLHGEDGAFVEIQMENNIVEVFGQTQNYPDGVNGDNFTAQFEQERVQKFLANRASCSTLAPNTCIPYCLHEEASLDFDANGTLWFCHCQVQDELFENFSTFFDSPIDT